MNSPFWQADFEAEVKELGKRYIQDEVALIGSISKHCHEEGAEGEEKKRKSLPRLFWF